MPPRTLPWLAAAKAKSHNTLSTSSPAPLKRKRDATPASDEDLVDPDLNPTGVSTPERRAKQRLLRPDRSPSTSPPPAPPAVEYMREGYTADDAWMMVEDEFFATAQLYTQHLHHAAYAERKRRAQARGEKVLRTLGRPTDGRTARDGRTVEREERQKDINKALGWDKEEDEEDLTDPLLGALMNDPRRMGRALEGVGKVKSKSRAANGFLRSPEKARKIDLDDLEGDSRAIGDDLSEADSDDLDGPVARPSKYHAAASRDLSVEPSVPAINPRHETGIFKKLAAAAGKDEPRQQDYIPAKSHVDDGRRKLSPYINDTNGQSSKKSFTTSIDDFEPINHKIKEETASYLVKRRHKREEEEKRKAKEKKAAVEVPTFMF